MNIAITVVSVLLSQATPSAEVAEPSSGEDELSALSLEELLYVPVTTAAKMETQISETPVVIEVITAQQIRQRGYRHVADLLNDLMGNNEEFGNWGVGEPVSQNIGMGFRFDGANILLLFNGQRLNAFMPGNRFGAEEYLLQSIEKVEVIRGPGSALYGANAFTGVVNLISRSETAHNEVRASVGAIPTAGGANAEGSWATKLGENTFTSGAVRVQHERGQRLLLENQLFGDTYVHDGLDRAIDADAFFKHKNLRVYLKVLNQVRRPFTTFNGVNPDGEKSLTLDVNAHSLGADYTFKPSEQLELKASVGGHFDRLHEVPLVPFFNAVGELEPQIVTRDGRRFETLFLINGQSAYSLTLDAELQATWKYFESNRLLLGLYVSRDKVLGSNRPGEFTTDLEVVEYTEFKDPANDWTVPGSKTRLTTGGYLQADYVVAEQLFLNAGGRLDIYDGTDGTYVETNPRIGLAYKNKTFGNLKLNVGRATRIPNGWEIYTKLVLVGSLENRPERITTAQASWERSWGEHVNTQVGFFYSTISNRLVTDANITDEERALGFIAQYINQPNKKFKSAGVEGRVIVQAGQLTGSANATRFLDTDDGDGNALGDIPLTMVNCNLNYAFHWLNINVNANYRRDYTAYATDPRPAMPDRVLLGATLIVTPPAQPFELRVGGRNLLNTDVRHPNSLPDFNRGFPGRRIEVWSDLTYKYSL